MVAGGRDGIVHSGVGKPAALPKSSWAGWGPMRKWNVWHQGTINRLQAGRLTLANRSLNRRDIVPAPARTWEFLRHPFKPAPANKPHWCLRFVKARGGADRQSVMTEKHQYGAIYRWSVAGASPDCYNLTEVFRMNRGALLHEGTLQCSGGLSCSYLLSAFRHMGSPKRKSW